jgi:hypothetical protein
VASKRIPVAVLARAKAVAKAHPPEKRPKPPANAAREKVVAALKRLHPMD